MMCIVIFLSILYITYKTKKLFRTSTELICMVIFNELFYKNAIMKAYFDLHLYKMFVQLYEYEYPSECKEYLSTLPDRKYIDKMINNEYDIISTLVCNTPSSFKMIDYCKTNRMNTKNEVIYVVGKKEYTMRSIIRILLKNMRASKEPFVLSERIDEPNTLYITNKN